MDGWMDSRTAVVRWTEVASAPWLTIAGGLARCGAVVVQTCLSTRPRECFSLSCGLAIFCVSGLPAMSVVVHRSPFGGLEAPPEASSRLLQALPRQRSTEHALGQQ